MRVLHLGTKPPITRIGIEDGRKILCIGFLVCSYHATTLFPFSQMSETDSSFHIPLCAQSCMPSISPCVMAIKYITSLELSNMIPLQRLLNLRHGLRHQIRPLRIHHLNPAPIPPIHNLHHTNHTLLTTLQLTH